ncbi:12016_t:CDS:2, partial [Cetraspora pellucida]
DVLCIEDPLFGESVDKELDVLADFGVRLTFDCVGEEIDFEQATRPVLKLNFAFEENSD